MKPYPRSYTYESREDYDDAVDRWMDWYEGECERGDNEEKEDDDE